MNNTLILFFAGFAAILLDALGVFGTRIDSQIFSIIYQGVIVGLIIDLAGKHKDTVLNIISIAAGFSVLTGQIFIMYGIANAIGIYLVIFSLIAFVVLYITALFKSISTKVEPHENKSKIVLIVTLVCALVLSSSSIFHLPFGIGFGIIGIIGFSLSLLNKFYLGKGVYPLAYLLDLNLVFALIMLSQSAALIKAVI